MERIAQTLGLGALALWLGTVPLASQAPMPERITSDTPEYCLHLLDRVSEMVRLSASPPPPEVTFLSSEGQRMCDQGQTRGGILRLRHALLLMLHPREAP
jgi:hypothetical protein